MQYRAYPNGQPTVITTLNVGQQVSAAALTGTAIGYHYYLTAANGTTFNLQGTGAPNSFSTGVAINHVTLSGITPPGADTSGFGNPLTAPTLTASGSGSTLLAGTYQLVYTYVSALGESAASPATSITITAGQLINLGAIAQPPTTVATLEILVPRLEEWHVTRYAVLTSTATSRPAVELYIDTLAPVNLLDSSAIGDRNSGNADLTMRPGQRFICRWLAVDTGAMCTLSVYGSKASPV